MVDKPYSNTYIHKILLQTLLEKDKDLPEDIYGNLMNFLMKHGLVVVGEDYLHNLCELKRSLTKIHHLIQDEG